MHRGTTGWTRQKPSSPFFILYLQLELDYIHSRPRTRWYQLRGLPLVGSEGVCPQRNSSFVITRGKCNSSFVITRGSAQDIGLRSSRPSQEIINANRKSGTPVTVKSPTVKCPMVRPQRYRQKTVCTRGTVVVCFTSRQQEVRNRCDLSCQRHTFTKLRMSYRTLQLTVLFCKASHQNALTYTRMRV